MSDAEGLVFDLYGTLVDPIAMSAELARFLPATVAQDVAVTWRQKQVEYSFRLTVMNRYRTFEWITARSLDQALLLAGQELGDEDRRRILQRYDRLEPFPDVAPALEMLAAAGYDMHVLSNGSPGMLRRCLRSSGLAAHFSSWLSVDAVRAFKPAPQVYRHASDTIGRPVGEIRLISCNQFDVVGGQAAGMRTGWVNRSGGPFDMLGGPPGIVGSDLLDLAHRLVDG